MCHDYWHPEKCIENEMCYLSISGKLENTKFLSVDLHIAINGYKNVKGKKLFFVI